MAEIDNKTSSVAKPKPSISEIFKKAGERALQGGLAGAAAMGINVMTLMWMRTTINYQYRHGGSTMVALKTLYADGGVPRFYRGLVPALIQGPLSRFGDTAANTGALVLMDSFDTTSRLPIWAKTGAASISAALFRVFLMPVDTFKTTMQVQGKDGVKNLLSKFRAKGPSVFYHGSLAAASATAVGHYPWFSVFNTLQATIPQPDGTLEKLGRNALIGFSATCVSDTLSNSIRVVKVYKQASVEALSYPEVVKRILAEDGMEGLLFRGLKTKLISNGAQGVMFSVLWKFLDEQFFGKK